MVALATVTWISSRPTPSMPSPRTYLIRTFPADLVQRTVRFAILDSSTFAYLHSGIRLASLRRGMWITAYKNGHVQDLQELPTLAWPFMSFDLRSLCSLSILHLTRGASLHTSLPRYVCDVQMQFER